MLLPQASVLPLLSVLRQRDFSLLWFAGLAISSWLSGRFMPCIHPADPFGVRCHRPNRHKDSPTVIGGIPTTNPPCHLLLLPC